MLDDIDRNYGVLNIHLLICYFINASVFRDADPVSCAVVPLPIARSNKVIC